MVSDLISYFYSRVNTPRQKLKPILGKCTRIKKNHKTLVLTSSDKANNMEMNAPKIHNFYRIRLRLYNYKSSNILFAKNI